MSKKKKESPYWKYPKVYEYQKDYNKMYYMANREKIIDAQKKSNEQNEAAIA